MSIFCSNTNCRLWSSPPELPLSLVSFRWKDWIKSRIRWEAWRDNGYYNVLFKFNVFIGIFEASRMNIIWPDLSALSLGTLRQQINESCSCSIVFEFPGLIFCGTLMSFDVWITICFMLNINLIVPWLNSFCWWTWHTFQIISFGIHMSPSILPSLELVMT